MHEGKKNKRDETKPNLIKLFLFVSFFFSRCVSLNLVYVVEQLVHDEKFVKLTHEQITFNFVSDSLVICFDSRIDSICFVTKARCFLIKGMISLRVYILRNSVSVSVFNLKKIE